MKKYATALALFSLTTILGACGGGGGASSPSGPVTQAVAKAYVFGAMSTNSKITNLQTSFICPTGVLANYSTPAPSGFPANVYPLRGGSVVPSGPVQVAPSDISGTYNTATGEVTVSLLNSPFNGGPKDLRSSKVGDGTEIAAVVFKLATPGVLPTLPTPWQAPTVSGMQLVPTVPVASILPLTGCQLNLKAVYQ